MVDQPIYKLLKRRTPYNADEYSSLVASTSGDRVEALGLAFQVYLEANIPIAITRRRGLAAYRINPYVLLTTATTMGLREPASLANFLVNIKLYMGLETSFGKSIESVVMRFYPLTAGEKWSDPAEKIDESVTLVGMEREEKARARVKSVWREVDRSVVRGDRRHLLTIKSGPSTINDTQVAAMYAAIDQHNGTWLDISAAGYGVKGIDVVIGLTYGTAMSTNNKENQILAKLLAGDFAVASTDPVVVERLEGLVRAYRVVGIDFWSYVGDPETPRSARFVFLEILMALLKALRVTTQSGAVEVALDRAIGELATSIYRMRPSGDLPDWVKDEFSVEELLLLQAAAAAFYDTRAVAADNAG
ncbi:hypothetical protein BH24ACT7_BH24ACT7_05320 [soil metagenome]